MEKFAPLSINFTVLSIESFSLRGCVNVDSWLPLSTRTSFMQPFMENVALFRMLMGAENYWDDNPRVRQRTRTLVSSKSFLHGRFPRERKVIYFFSSIPRLRREIHLTMLPSFLSESCQAQKWKSPNRKWNLNEEGTPDSEGVCTALLPTAQMETLRDKRLELKQI